jgi:hypothetical protein
MSRPPLILLIGSYNGQDSLGDECLLKCVISQYRRAAGKPLRFALHAHASTPLLRDMMRDTGFVANQGLQSAEWRLAWQGRRLKIPAQMRKIGALALLPEQIAAEATLGLHGSRQVMRQLAEARLLHVFGGTNFAEQWFALNEPSYIATSLALKLRGRPTYFGPQQYGPMSPAQRRLHTAYMRVLVKDYRARNSRCVEQLDLDPAKLTPDEVYSNRLLYPIVSQRPEAPRYILVNVRGGAMANDRLFDDDELGPLAALFAALHARFGLPLKFFSVSGDSFVDDDRSFHALKRRLGANIPIDLHGRVRDEHELMALASGALGCVSMSFHGCVLSSFAGIPSVPLTSGPYYDHKYVGYDVYGDGRPVPLVSLADAANVELHARVFDYLEHYDAVAAAARRARAAEALERYYDDICSAEQLSRP